MAAQEAIKASRGTIRWVLKSCSGRDLIHFRGDDDSMSELVGDTRDTTEKVASAGMILPVADPKLWKTIK
jgi:hypothetical protein